MAFTGIDDFDAQLRKFLNTLIYELDSAVSETMLDAKDSLRKHIREDVYDESVYSPKVYKRRSENDGLGTPLDYLEEPNARIIPPAGGNVNGNLVVTSRIYYNPTGEHKYKKWHTADHNDLIGRIEKKEPRYTWGQNKVPPRPFWQNFITEMVDNQELEKNFVRHMSGKEDIVADGAIVEEISDREY